MKRVKCQFATSKKLRPSVASLFDATPSPIYVERGVIPTSFGINDWIPFNWTDRRKPMEIKILYSDDKTLIMDEIEAKTGERFTSEYHDVTPQKAIELIAALIRSHAKPHTT